MNYYKDLENKLHALESSEFEYLLPAGCVEITEAEYLALLPPPPDPRESVSCASWQLKRALTAEGLRDAVEAAIAAADQDTKDMWQAATFRRLNPRIIALATEMGKTADDIDALFTLALTFEE